MNTEQLEEIEVLNSIYPEEFELLPPLESTNEPSIKIHLVPGSSDGKVHGNDVTQQAIELC